MGSDEALSSAHSSNALESRTFTVNEANAALVYVRPIVEDIVNQYRELLRLRAEREELMLTTEQREAAADAGEKLQAAKNRLDMLSDELTEVGCVLKDWALGLVDFPAVLEGRRIWLCWKLGESAVEHWHEWEAGAAGRQPLDERFE